MSEKNCSSGQLDDVKIISSLCAAVSAIFAVIITALIIPKDVFLIGELWGVAIHRYQVIVCGGVIACFPAYLSAKFFCCRRCPGPPEKAEDRYGFPYIVDGG